MSDQQIVFDDGATYDRYMGRWSRIVGDVFLDWLAPERNLRWLDVGCGNGAFTEMLFERCAPAAIDGVDPSQAQLAFARAQPAAKLAKFHQGDAMALPFPDDAFDAAVMPLVIFFVPDPAKGVAEMARVVRAGGIVAAYGWDLTGGGFPYTALQQEMRELGVTHGMPPSPEAARLDVLQELWTGAGLQSIETRAIEVQRTFDDFEDWWQTVLTGPSVSAKLAAMAPDVRAALKERMRAHHPADASGRVTYGARANAVKGRVPR